MPSSPVHNVNKGTTYRSVHFYNLKPSVQLRKEIGRARESDRTRADEAPVQFGVFTDAFTERSALEVDRKRGDLLGETQEVDGRVQQARLEFRFEVDNARSVSTGRKT